MSVLQLRDILLFGVPIVIAASTLGWMHWYPWNNGAKPLDRVDAYTMGTAVVVGAPVGAMLVASALGMSYGELFWASHLFINTVVCGATVKIAYHIDEGKAIDGSSTHVG